MINNIKKVSSLLIYPATFENDEGSILVLFPDIPEAITEADNLNEAFIYANEVLGAILEDKTEFPEASSVEDVQKQFPNKTVALIGLDIVAYRRKYHSKTIRKNVTIPEWLSDIAESEKVNFSQTLTEALKEKLGV